MIEWVREKRLNYCCGSGKWKANVDGNCAAAIFTSPAAAAAASAEVNFLRT